MSLRSEVLRILNEVLGNSKKITELPAATTPLDGTEWVEIVQGGQSKKVQTTDVGTGGGGSGTVESVTGDGVDNTDPDNPVLTFPEASEVPFTPAGTIAATDVQAAIEELAGELYDEINTVNDAINDAQAAAEGYADGLIIDSIADSDATHAPSRNAVFDALALKVAKAGDTMSGDLAMGTNKVTGLGAATTNGDALRYEDVIGVQDLYIPASAMWPRSTSGCAALAKSELATSLLNIQTLDFDQTTQEFAQFTIVLPRKYNNGTVTAVVYWTAAAGSGDVQWGISGGAYSNDDALTVALGTAQTVDDTFIATNDLHITSATSAITLAGTPADADFLGFQISRNPGSDTLSGDAKLLGVSIRITTDAGKDA